MPDDGQGPANGGDRDVVHSSHGTHEIVRGQGSAPESDGDKFRELEAEQAQQERDRERAAVPLADRETPIETIERVTGISRLGTTLKHLVAGGPRPILPAGMPLQSFRVKGLLWEATSSGGGFEGPGGRRIRRVIGGGWGYFCEKCALLRRPYGRHRHPTPQEVAEAIDCACVVPPPAPDLEARLRIADSQGVRDAAIEEGEQARRCGERTQEVLAELEETKAELEKVKALAAAVLKSDEPPGLRVAAEALRDAYRGGGILGINGDLVCQLVAALERPDPSSLPRKPEAAPLDGPELLQTAEVIRRALAGPLRVTEATQMRRLLRRALSHYKLNTRWPCPECDRPGPDAPLRINIIRTEDGNEYRLGCSHCNADGLLADIEAALASGDCVQPIAAPDRFPRIDPASGFPLDPETGAVLGETTSQQQTAFVKRYCEARGWNLAALTDRQATEIRRQPEWSERGESDV